MKKMLILSVALASIIVFSVVAVNVFVAKSEGTESEEDKVKNVS